MTRKTDFLYKKKQNITPVLVFSPRMSKAIIIEYDSEEEIQTPDENSDVEILEEGEEIFDEDQEETKESERIPEMKSLKISGEKKRKLTEEEMYEITDFLQVDPDKDWETSMAVMDENRNDLFEQLKNIEIYPSQIPKLKMGIKNDYETSKIEPGTAIGCDSSLAIGEPTTQMSQPKTTKVVLRQGNKTINTTMGEFIDSEIEKAWMIVSEDNGSEIVPDGVFKVTEIMTVSKDEKVSWNKITELSRHPVNGDLVRIKTDSGRETVCTLSHSLLTRNLNGVVPILGSDIQVGHRVPVFFRTPEVDNPISEIELWKDTTVDLTSSFGEFIGIYIAEGSTCKSSNSVVVTTNQEYYKNVSYEFFSEMGKNAKTREKPLHKIQGSKKEYKSTDHIISHKLLSQWLRTNIGTYSHNKEIPGFIYGCKREFIAGVLRGMFDGDGNFHGSRKSIKYHTTSSELIQQVAFLLSYFGIFSTYQIEKEACDEHRALWVLLIFGPKFGKIFSEQIGTNNEKNKRELDSYINDKDGRNFIDQVPNCAELVSKIGRGLKLPGASRNYGRWVKKESEGSCIGKNTLIEYVKLFTEKNEEKDAGFEDDISLLQQAIDADVIWDRVVEVEIIKADPDEKVYDFSVAINETFATQSGILVHNTLNSIDYKEHIVVKNGTSVTCPKIGDFVDKIVIDNKKDVKVYDEVTEYVDINFMNLETPCVDENGKMHWKKIEAVTRHPPPGGNKLLEVKTQTGRRTTATKAKSFLLRRDNKVVGVNGSELTVGDRLPVTVKFPRPLENDRLKTINLSRYLSKEKFVFGTDLWKAREIKERYNKGGRKEWKDEIREEYTYGGRNTRWWSDNFGIDFTLPYHRCDAAMDALEGKKKEYIGNEIIKKGMVYTTRRSVGEVNEIPEEFELDNDFGFVVGAYIAEGHCANTGTQCIISNNDEKFRKRIETWCDKHKLGYHVQVQHDKNFKGATSTDLRIHSTLMVEWFTNMCGNYSQNKHLPDFSLFANDEFIKGMIDGYFSGDGCVTLKGDITCSSTSELLIDELMMLLGVYDIFSYKGRTHIKKNNIGSLNILPGFNIAIRAGNVRRYYQNFTFTLDYKQERLNLNKNKKYKSTYYHNDCIPGIKSKQINGDIHRDLLIKILDKGVDVEDIDVLYDAVDTEVLFDEIISIDEVESTTPFVYDLTVADTRNFSGRDGLALADTFHLAGVSSANVTLGVPRTNEILNASKNQKTNVLQISLLPTSTDLTSLQKVRDKCRVLFEERYVDQCITKHEVLNKKYDSLSKEDQIWYDLFDMFYTTHYRDCDWCIRLTLNKLIMYQYKLTTEKIAKLIEEEYKDCRCVFSPDENGIIDVYIDTTNVDTPSVILATKKKSGKRGKKDDDEKKKKKKKKGEEDDDEDEQREPRSLINDENKDYYFVSRVALDYILDIKLGGVEGITKVYYQLDNKSKEWKIETSGTNMREVMNHPEVDFRHVVSNNMWEIFGILGIEAARRFLVSEITATISFGGTFIDPVHPALLADSMTSTGTITSVNRYGISKSVVGVLTPASFEQSHQNMLDAPAKGVTDDLSTVSAGIITAKHVRLGTGYFGLFTNRKKLKNMTIPKPLPMIMEEVKNIPEDSRFPSSNAVFKNGGTGKVTEKETKRDVVSLPAMEYEDF
ncbi:MAG: LAGLIDADG family homing endonuclease [Candidatus Colwellbacteria bacterium]|nr:LAGLIDADG family homing endonuclease [Candidatus Colwellbacteria bacterium]